MSADSAKAAAAALQLWSARADAALARALPDEDAPPLELHRAMRYAVLGGGKRLRPVLVYATGAAFGVDPDILDSSACAVEIIHAYSLVHDDLPAMDDDDLRRGRPTCHVVFGEAMAILAGDALQALAFEVLADDARLLGRDVHDRVVLHVGVAANADVLAFVAAHDREGPDARPLGQLHVADDERGGIDPRAGMDPRLVAGYRADRHATTLAARNAAISVSASPSSRRIASVS